MAGGELRSFDEVFEAERKNDGFDLGTDPVGTWSAWTVLVFDEAGDAWCLECAFDFAECVSALAAHEQASFGGITEFLGQSQQ